eukprot:TRINITY_DN4944_c0_g1_i1.p1 TRINITY_DN4944_c0_g1~~TRINITY_DN4944_c0_g1_i1.p1  ORF type:complete len:593 (-),score=93.65 TRINITY_DN4944_c0_g1_i1:298-2076(-)
MDELARLATSVTDDPRGPPCCVGLLAIALILCFREHIDRFAARFLVLYVEGGMHYQVRFHELEKRNQETRNMYVSSLTLVVVAFLALRVGISSDSVLTSVLLVIMPLKFLINAHHEKYGWVNNVVHYIWFLVFWHCGGMASVSIDRVIRIMVIHYSWNEISLRSLSMLLVNHLLCTTFFLLSFPGHHTVGSLLLSAASIALFCYRRWPPSAQPDEEPRQLSDLTDRCAELVQLVLESGDELCQANVEALNQALGLLTGKQRPSKTTSDSSVGLSHSAVGKGTSGGLEAAGVAQPEPRGTADWLLESCLDDFDFPMQPEEAPVLVTAPGSAIGASHRGIQGTLLFQDHPSVHETMLPSTQFVQYAEELVRMSFEAMAQLDVASGELLWTNGPFKELTSVLGGGNQALGFGSLKAGFLQFVPSELRHMTDTFGTQLDGLELWSATKVVGPPGRKVILWVLHRAAPLFDMQSIPTPIGPCSPPTVLSSPEHSNSEGAWPGSPSEFPCASQHQDPHARVLCERFVGGRGRRQVQMLWNRYGKKNVNVNSRSLDRNYYKCHKKGCGARLRIDVDQLNGQDVHLEATGTHNHPVQLVG